MPPLLHALDAGVLTLTLDRPGRRNALDPELIEALHEALDRAELDAGVRVVVVRGAGDDFCAGIDPDALVASAARALADNEQSALRLALVFRRFRELPKPVVAAVHGHALGDGAGIAIGCDVVIAAESANIGYPDIRESLVPPTSLALLYRTVGEKLAVDLVLSGRLLTASEALAAGCVTRVVPDAALEREVAAVAAPLVGASASALALHKRLVYELAELPLTKALELGARADALARSAPDFQAAAVRFLRR
jgi:enoyl-CoA hydratase/carnithine racemase